MMVRPKAVVTKLNGFHDEWRGVLWFCAVCTGLLAFIGVGIVYTPGLDAKETKDLLRQRIVIVDTALTTLRNGQSAAMQQSVRDQLRFESFARTVTIDICLQRSWDQLVRMQLVVTCDTLGVRKRP